MGNSLGYFLVARRNKTMQQIYLCRIHFFFLLFHFHFLIVSCYHFERCELAKKLIENGIPSSQINDWICLVEGESQFNSSAIGSMNWDGSKDYGLFQISEKYWCLPGVKRNTGCKLKCEDLIDDDITDDVKCVLTIYNEHEGLSGNGFNAWVAWKVRCKDDPDLERYTRDCKDDESGKSFLKFFKPGVMEPVKRKADANIETDNFS